MVLYIKDATLTTQPISTQLDIAGSLVPVHVPASVIAGVATPVSADNPLPVVDAVGAPAVDGSGTITSATVAQTIFAGVTPDTGFSFANNCTTGTIYVCDRGTAADKVGFPVVVGGTYTTPDGYRPVGPVSIYGGANGGNFEARRY